MDKKSKVISGLKDGKIIIQKPNKYFCHPQLLTTFLFDIFVFVNTLQLALLVWLTSPLINNGVWITLVHFLKANKSNSILLQGLAMVLQQKGHFTEAISINQLIARYNE